MLKNWHNRRRLQVGEGAPHRRGEVLEALRSRSLPRGRAVIDDVSGEEVVHEQVVADDDTAAIAYTLTGTHEGEFQGIASTGRRIEARGKQIARSEDGRIAERWASSDELGILRQLEAD